MRKDKLNDYVSGIDDAFIRESASVRGGMKLRKAGIIVSAMKIAACLLLAVGITTARGISAADEEAGGRRQHRCHRERWHLERCYLRR